MKNQLLCVGNSHLAAARDVLVDVASAHNLELVFLVENWIDDAPVKLMRLAVEPDPTEFQMDHPNNPYSVTIDPTTIYGVVSVGSGFGGPGDFFRKIASESFTGNYDGVPSPREVKCPWCLKPSAKYIDPEPGLLSSTCLKYIFNSHLDMNFALPLSKALLSLANSTGRHVHIPTPPLPAPTVAHRFGQHVFESDLGNVMIRVWEDRVASVNSSSNSRLLSPHPEVLNDGWLKSSLAAASYPGLQIHANKLYGYTFTENLNEWLQAV